ncbi:Major facilitator superfamily domain general substrate transporter [Penicillium brevicompactum]|uniref:Major facilitator superfamily domain general substrate transporter n=1 Tax=Penicillium brevicompactum TaxID=5074 RepID=UPI00254207EB|nr:Major facilitator superfamily domain general substrate transporter [Penicillium brevicompactum]KAJ5318777.1 Major facilitator superfamily domain general substrate transporter [Penicillium brevicompactum]
MNSESTLSEAVPPYSSFSPAKKRYIVATAAGAGLFSSLSAQIYFPALNTLADDLNVSTSLINLTVTSYMIFQGIAPMFIGDFADRTGRRPAYIICFVIYIASNIGLALQDSYTALIVLRCLQSSGISSSVALSAATVADVSTKQERGSMMGFVMAGNFMGPAIGPIIGGLLAQYLGWRSIFWFLTIASGVFLLPLLFFLPETARNVVGDGSSPAQTWNRPFIQYMQCGKMSKDTASSTDSIDRASMDSPKKIEHKLRFPNPLKPLILVWHPNSIIVLLIYTAQYGLDELEIGLCYITLGTGSIVASVITGRLLDWNYKRMAAKLSSNPTAEHVGTADSVPVEKSRSMVTIPLVVLGSVTVLAFGWVLKFGEPLPAPEVLLFFVGVGQTGGFISTSTLLVDLHTANPAAATAANNMVRSFFSAAASAAIDPMLTAMGRGWAFTLVAFILLGTIPFLLLLCGMGRKEKDSAKQRESSIEKAEAPQQGPED